MTTTDLLTIGQFAAATGLTPGALRFYSDSAILVPAHVDASSGYRYYAGDQTQRAVTIRRLREIGMPLQGIAQVLAGDPAPLDTHITGLIDDARRAQRTSTELHAALHPEGKHATMIVNGPIFAGAVDQILTATAHHPDHPVLGGVFLEFGSGILTLTATDRYRLSTRTMPVPQQDYPPQWSRVVDGDDLRAVLPYVRRQHEVSVGVDDSGIDFGPDDHRCRSLPAEFPDYTSVFEALPLVVTRVVVSRSAFVRAMEDRQSEHLTITASPHHVELTTPTASEPAKLDAVVTGPEANMTFAMTTLYPAVVTAVGPEIMIDMCGPYMPVVVRSADDGDLTTLAMPVDPRGVSSAE